MYNTYKNLNQSIKNKINVALFAKFSKALSPNNKSIGIGGICAIDDDETTLMYSATINGMDLLIKLEWFEIESEIMHAINNS